MRPLISTFLFSLATTVFATSDPVNVYLFPEQRSSSSVPTLSADAARLIITQRLGVSQYHSIHQASSDTLSFINTFGGRRPLLFSNGSENDRRSYLVIILEAVSAKLERLMMESLQSMEPSFRVSDPLSKIADKQFITDMMVQVQAEAPIQCTSDDFHLFSEDCWIGKSNFFHFSLSDDRLEEFKIMQSRILEFVEQNAAEAMIIAIPASGHESKDTESSRGTPSSVINRRAESALSNSANKAPVSRRSVLPLCHSSLDSCLSVTNNCSGHGSCFQKYAQDDVACYTCGCIPTVVFDEDSGRTQKTFWGGVDCSKEDISVQFWLLATFSITIISLVSWAIGMLFAVGEEKLPGVIGAGVSGAKAK